MGHGPSLSRLDAQLLIMSATALLLTGAGISSMIGYFKYLSTVSMYCSALISYRSDIMNLQGQNEISCDSDSSRLCAP